MTGSLHVAPREPRPLPKPGVTDGSNAFSLDEQLLVYNCKGNEKESIWLWNADNYEME